ncbi:OmpA family protein [Marinomonas posidonica]|uniref:OmpA/MotB domain protein n=1 Tax=Marinomonas posidonica (strain CECT 7376 / NCIMB 14433 / IVIA-Po-181) TaxID=491952 RepID=F6CX43_MARPP|nr:OmpA family protein [Marinomonas posidonica]AEF53297.1 OmpA/MotB domain protein [Marinomonas posidonica IVIA-Po-181]
MSFTIAKRTLLSSLIAAASFSTVTMAQPQPGFTITPSIGFYDMDNDRDEENDTAYSLSLGYQFDNPWAIELVYLNADTKSAANGDKIDVEQYRLDGLYHLPNVSRYNLTPYLAAGVGTTDLSSRSDQHVELNAGGGLKYAINDSLALRADFRLVNDVEDHHVDKVSSIGLQMTFGHKEKTAVRQDMDFQPIELDQKADQATEEMAETTPANEPETITEIEQPVIAEDKQPMTNKLEQEEPLPEPPVTADGTEPSLSEQAAVVAAQPPVKLNIQFGSNQTQVEQKFYPEIEKLATFLMENPNTTVVIEGHTDDTGAARYNQKVSEERANAIADVLVEIFGIPENRVSAIGYGEDKPLFDNDSAAHRKANRRVIAVISNNQA